MSRELRDFWTGVVVRKYFRLSIQQLETLACLEQILASIMSKLKKYVEENKNTKSAELEIIDRGVNNLTDAPGLCE